MRYLIVGLLLTLAACGPDYVEDPPKRVLYTRTSGDTGPCLDGTPQKSDPPDAGAVVGN